jgi:hypothetical protein
MASNVIGGDGSYQKLLTAKDASIEHYLTQLINLLELPENATADEIQNIWNKDVLEKVSQLSPILALKLNPIINHMLSTKLNQIISDGLAHVTTHLEPSSDMIGKYKKCFEHWIDSPHVSFKTNNKCAIGNIKMKDYFILQYFTMVTCRRVRADNCLQLGLSGESTVGKSSLFESGLIENAHYYVSCGGVGRFQVHSKSVLLFHDVNLEELLPSKDQTIIKTLARSEPSSSKVHSSINSIPPIHLFYTSNVNMFDHKFPSPNGGSLGGLFYSTRLKGNKYIDDHLPAFQNRFLECFCKSRPNLDKNWFPTSGMFLKIHVVLGMYDRVLQVLEKYQKDDFASRMQPMYVLSGLAKYSSKYNSEFQTDIRPKILELAASLLDPVDQLTIPQLMTP